FPTRSIAASRAGNISHAVATPLVATEKLVGTFLVVRRTHDAFADDEVKLVESCAAHLAAVVAHARLFEAERRRARQPGLLNAPRVARLGQKALVAVPLVSRGEAIGAVLLADTDPARRFDEAEVERAVAVSNQLATAIANAQLFEDLRASYRELERAQERYV